MSKKRHSQQSNTAYRNNLWILVAAAAVVVLILTVVAATFRTDGADPHALQADAGARQAALASEHSPALGNPDAKVQIVEFLDPACETCALFFPMVKQWLVEMPEDLRLSVRHVAFHEGSEHALKILEASRNQNKYWQTLEALLASQNQWVQHHTVQPDKIEPAIAGVGLDMEQLRADLNSVEVMRRIEKDKKDSIVLKVVATPEYFVNGRQLPSFGQQQLADLVREELQK
jgi:protein-disulfide isomerase